MNAIWMVPCVLLGILLLVCLFWLLLGVRYIPHNRVGIVEKLWSLSGSLRDGRIIAMEHEAGFQAEVLRGGLHWLYFPWQYRIHKMPLVIITENRIGYVYARDGRPLAPEQTLGRVFDCGNFQDARAFLAGAGLFGQLIAMLFAEKAGVWENTSGKVEYPLKP